MDNNMVRKNLSWNRMSTTINIHLLPIQNSKPFAKTGTLNVSTSDPIPNKEKRQKVKMF